MRSPQRYPRPTIAIFESLTFKEKSGEKRGRIRKRKKDKRKRKKGERRNEKKEKMGRETRPLPVTIFGYATG